MQVNGSVRPSRWHEHTWNACWRPHELNVVCSASPEVISDLPSDFAEHDFGHMHVPSRIRAAPPGPNP